MFSTKGKIRSNRFADSTLQAPARSLHRQLGGYGSSRLSWTIEMIQKGNRELSPFEPD